MNSKESPESVAIILQKKVYSNPYPLCYKPACYHSTMKKRVTVGIISFTKFYLGKTQIRAWSLKMFTTWQLAKGKLKNTFSGIDDGFYAFIEILLQVLKIQIKISFETWYFLKIL